MFSKTSEVEKKNIDNDNSDSFCYRWLDHVYPEKTSTHVDNIDDLVDHILDKNQASSYNVKVEKKCSVDKLQLYNGRRKICTTTNKKLFVRKVLAIVLTFLLISVTIFYMLPNLYGDFSTDISVSLIPENAYNNDTMFVNVTIPAFYNIGSVAADMGGIESVNLLLFDNTTEEQLWQAVWIVHDVEFGEHVVMITAVDEENTYYYAGVRWSVLSDDKNVSSDNMSMIEEPSQINESTIVSSSNQTINESYQETPISEQSINTSINESEFSYDTNSTDDKICDNGTSTWTDIFGDGDNKSSSSEDTQDEEELGKEDESWWVYPELKPNDIFVKPQFNWDAFWNTFEKHALWSLEAWDPSTEQWIYFNDSLTINIDAISENSRKLTLIFDAPAPITTDYHLTLDIDYLVKEYVHKADDYSYNLSFDADGEEFSVSYDFSDIASIPGVITTNSVKKVNGKDSFWFQARRNNVPSGHHIELDPTYTVFTGTDVYTAYNSQRKLVRQSNGTLWCAFRESEDVHVAWSEDAGVTWTDYEVWGDDGSQYPSIAVDSNDVVHLVFHSYKNDADDYQLEYSNSTNWGTIVQIRDEDKHHKLPSIAIDSNDNIHIVYEKGEEGTSNGDQVAYINSTDGGATWGTEKILTDEADSGDGEWFPSIAIDSNDFIHVVFYCKDHYSEYDDILHMQSSDGGDTWTGWEADPVYQDDSHDETKPCIAIDDNDVLHVVWCGVDQYTNDQVGYSYNDSSGWSSVEWVTWDSDEEYRYPSISVNDNDYVHVGIEVVGTRLNHSVNDTTSWTEDIALAVSYNFPSLISAQWPVINETKTNRPKTGYAMICGFGTSNVTYYASPDLSWNTNSFISWWTTNNTGTSNDDQITLPLQSGGTYDFTVDWGDGTSSEIDAYDHANVTHNYSTPGVYTVNISGTIVGWSFNNSGDERKIINITNWGPLRLGNTGSYFYDARNLRIQAEDILNTSGTTTMFQAFRDCDAIVAVPNMSIWNMSEVVNMSEMFRSADAFNQNISAWDTSSVTDMANMFQGAYAFNQNISAWNTSSVTDMSYMFNSADAFNQSLNEWNTSSVTDISNMFN